MTAYELQLDLTHLDFPQASKTNKPTITASPSASATPKPITKATTSGRFNPTTVVVRVGCIHTLPAVERVSFMIRFLTIPPPRQTAQDDTHEPRLLPTRLHPFFYAQSRLAVNTVGPRM